MGRPGLCPRPQILEKRGNGISNEELDSLSAQRYEELSKPESDDASSFIGLGYGLSLFGGLLGSLIGWYLMTSQKVLPDGKNLPRYAPKSRAHGKRMFWIGLVMTIVLLLLRLQADEGSGRSFFLRF